MTASINMLRELETMRQNGERVSLFRLAANCLMNYSTAWRLLDQMERAGMVEVRNRGKAPLPLDIRPRVRQLELFERCDPR